MWCSYMCLSSQHDEIELKQPASKLASILLGELVAIKITLNYLIEEKSVGDISTILIFCDSQSVVEILQLGWDKKNKKLLWTYNSLFIYLKGFVQR